MTDLGKQAEESLKAYLAKGYGVLIPGGRVILDQAEAIRYLHYQQEQQGTADPHVPMTKDYDRDPVN